MAGPLDREGGRGGLTLPRGLDLLDLVAQTGPIPLKALLDPVRAVARAISIDLGWRSG